MQGVGVPGSVIHSPQAIRLSPRQNSSIPRYSFALPVPAARLGWLAPALTLGTLALAASAQAQVTQYGSQASFKAATSGLTTFSFEGCATAGKATQYAAKHVEIMQVAVEEVGATRILGYISLSMKPVNRMSLPNSKKLPGGEYTVAFISQLAADKEFQGSGIGEKLLLFAQFQALRVSAVFGLVGVALDLLHVEDENPAITQKRRLFYTNRQLEPLIDDAQRFYKSMDAIRRMNFNL